MSNRLLLNVIKEKQVLIYALILSCIFILTLRPITGWFGGLIYLALGKIIPSLIVIMIAYYLTSHFIKSEKRSIKIIMFVVFTFIVGLNTNILYALHLMNYQPTDFKMQVISPIHKTGKSIVFSTKPLNNNDISLLSSPFTYMRVTGNAGSMSLYFKYPNSNALLDKTWLQLGQRIQYKQNDFNVLYLMQNTFNGVLFTIHILDKVGGHIILEAKYPTVLKIKAPMVYLNQPQAFSHTISLLLHDNFWTWFFEYFFDTNTLYDLMVKSKVNWFA